MDGRFGFLPQFFDAQNHLHAGHVVEMPLNALQLAMHVIVQRLGDFHMVSAQFDLHDIGSWLEVFFG
jgi:hypothetical protein